MHVKKFFILPLTTVCRFIPFR